MKKMPAANGINFFIFISHSQKNQSRIHPCASRLAFYSDTSVSIEEITMKSFIVVSVLALLAGCSNMGMSSGSSGYDTAAHNSGPLTSDENIFHSYSGGQ